jgi:hypothetical protein
MAPYPRRRHFSIKMVSSHYSPLILPISVYNLRYWQHHKTDHKERKKDNHFRIVWIYKTVSFQFNSEEAVKFKLFQLADMLCCMLPIVLFVMSKCDLNSYPGALSQHCKYNEECCVMTTYFFWPTHVSCCYAEILTQWCTPCLCQYKWTAHLTTLINPACIAVFLWNTEVSSAHLIHNMLLNVPTQF